MVNAIIMINLIDASRADNNWCTITSLGWSKLLLIAHLDLNGGPPCRESCQKPSLIWAVLWTKNLYQIRR